MMVSNMEDIKRDQVMCIAKGSPIAREFFFVQEKVLSSSVALEN